MFLCVRSIQVSPFVYRSVCLYMAQHVINFNRCPPIQVVCLPTHVESRAIVLADLLADKYPAFKSQ